MFLFDQFFWRWCSCGCWQWWRWRCGPLFFFDNLFSFVNWMRNTLIWWGILFVIRTTGARRSFSASFSGDSFEFSRWIVLLSAITCTCECDNLLSFVAFTDANGTDSLESRTLFVATVGVSGTEMESFNQLMYFCVPKGQRITLIQYIRLSVSWLWSDDESSSKSSGSVELRVSCK